MGRKNKSIFDILVHAPWWVSVFLSVVSYTALKYVIPLIGLNKKGQFDTTYMVYSGLISASPVVAPYVSLFFLFVAAISAFNYFGNRRYNRSIFSSDYLSRNLASEDSKKNNSDLMLNYLDYHLYDESSLANDVKEIEFHYANNVQISGPHSPNVSMIFDLSVDTLRKIEWFSFEWFCKIYYESIGYKVKKTGTGPDGGIDLVLYKNDFTTPYALIQCKTRTRRDIGVNYVRELMGVLASEKIDNGILIANSGFTKEAFAFATDNNIELIDIFKLWNMINELDDDKKNNLIDFLKSADFTTPTCPNCETKLVNKIAKKGRNVGKRFWGCKNYPRCHYTLHT